MSEPRSTRVCDTDDNGEGRGGAAALLAAGIAAGLTGATSAALLGAGWPLVLLTYWLAGTTGLLAAAACACGAVRVPRLRPSLLPMQGSFRMATVGLRRGRQ